MTKYIRRRYESEVSIANSRGPASLAALAKETGAKPVTVEFAAPSGDVVTPVYGTDLDAEGVRQGLAAAKPERSPDFQAKSGTPVATR